MFDRIDHPARGRRGGSSGRAGRVYIKDGDTLKGKGKETVPAGATLVMETPGGGGIGDPKCRDPAAVKADMEAGLVSGKAARQSYGYREGD